MKLLAKTTDTPQAFKKAVSYAARGAEAIVEAAGGKSTLLVNLGGQAPTHVLGETYHSQVPLRYGNTVAKLSVAAVSENLKDLAGLTLRVLGHPNALRELRTNTATMPIEDASVVWPEAKSPSVAGARITAGPQTGWSEQRPAVGDDALAFSPWHGIAAHQPLGGIMRARKTTYEMSSGFRSDFNRCPIHEPDAATVLPD